MVVFLRLGRVRLLAGRDALVLRVVEHEVLDAELLGELAGLLDCRVVLLVRLEFIAVTVLAEGFGEQPVRALGVDFVVLVVGLIAEAGEAQAIGEAQLVAELLCLRREDVESRELDALEVDDGAVLSSCRKILVPTRAKSFFLRVIFVIVSSISRTTSWQ